MANNSSFMVCRQISAAQLMSVARSRGVDPAALERALSERNVTVVDEPTITSNYTKRSQSALGRAEQEDRLQFQYLRGAGSTSLTADYSDDPTYNLTPENLLGEKTNSGPHSLKRLVPGFATSRAKDGARLLSTDYPFVGNIAAMIACVDLLTSFATHADSRVLMSNAGTSFTASYNGEAPASVGFVIDFGIGVNSFAPFDLVISSSGFGTLFDKLINLGAATVNRTNVTLRVDGSNGFSVFVPWAQRVTPTMQIAQPKVGVVTEESGEIIISNVPAAIVPALSATCFLLTASHPRTAEFASAVRLYSAR